MKKVKVQFTVRTNRQGSDVIDDVDFDFEEGITETEMDQQIDEYFKEWVWENIDAFYNVTEEDYIEHQRQEGKIN